MVMTNLRFTRSLYRQLLLIVFLIGASPLGQGQDPSSVGVDDLRKEDRKYSEVLKGLMKGSITANPSDKQHVEATDARVKLLLYRFANSNFFKPGTGENSIDRLSEEFRRDVMEIQGNKEKVREFARMFTKSCIENGLRVMETQIPIAQVNMGRCMVKLASLGQPEMATGIVQFLEGSSNDAVKYLILKSARELLSVPGNPQGLGKDSEQKLAAGLCDFANHPPTITPVMTREEVDGQILLRREALRAVAELRTPLYSPRVRPGLLLLRAMANVGYQPPLRMDERFEAAIGLARMHPDRENDYQTAYMAQQLALFLGQFTEFYNEKGAEEKRPWKVLASRMLEAIEGLKAETKDPYFLALFDAGKPGYKLLEDLEKGKKPNQSDLLTLAANPVKEPRLFRSQPDSSLANPDK